MSAVRKSLRATLVILTALVVIAAALSYVFNPRTLSQYTEMETRLTRVRSMNLTLARDNHALAREIEACRTDPRYLEYVARTEQGLVRDGQMVYVFPPRSGDAPPHGR